MAASAMLFTRPMCRELLHGFSSTPEDTHGQLRPERRSGPAYFGFTKTGMDELLVANVSMYRRGGRPFRLHWRAQGVIKVGQDVVNVLDPDAQADHLRQNASLALFLG